MLVLTVHIRIVSELFANAGVFAMTRENLGFVRQLTEMAQTVDDAEHAASREIGSADRAVEEGVAGEGYVLCLAPSLSSMPADLLIPVDRRGSLL